MIENLPESMQLLGLLSICVIGAFLPWRRTFQTSKMAMFPVMESPKIVKVRVKTLRGMNTESNTMTNDIIIRCRECNEKFERLDWMQNKSCENPNCRCPEVAKLREAANEVINKASESSRHNIINVKRSAIAPTGYDDTTAQYMVDVPDVMVIDMIVPKQFRGKKR